MISNRLAVAAVVLSAAVVGCGGGAEPKKIPTVTPEMKAEQDKAHAEAKAKMESQSTPESAPK